MLTTISSRMKAFIGIVLILMVFYRPVFSRPDGPTPGATLPAGPGAERVNKYCLTCHEADLIVQQRLTRAGWTKELDKMIRWGAAVPPDDREVLIAYLAVHYGDPSVSGVPPSSTLPAGPGADRVSKACLMCHEADIIIGQSLTRAQWGKELDKMARWGAVFSAEDRDPMVEYLAAHFGPERVH